MQNMLKAFKIIIHKIISQLKNTTLINKNRYTLHTFFLKHKVSQHGKYGNILQIKSYCYMHIFNMFKNFLRSFKDLGTLCPQSNWVVCSRRLNGVPWHPTCWGRQVIIRKTLPVTIVVHRVGKNATFLAR